MHLCCVCVLLPDNVACLREAASHKEAFDDVDFLIHCLRQAEKNHDSHKSKKTEYKL